MKTMTNNRHQILMIAVLAILLVATASLATAQGRGKSNCDQGGRGGRGEGNRIEMLAERLDLSEDQQKKIELIHENSQAERTENRKELMRLRNELQGEMMKDDPSEKTVLGLNEKMGGIKTEMKALGLKTRLAVREELTPEQRDKMLVMGNHGGKGHKGGRRGPEGKGRSCQVDCGGGRTVCPKTEK